MRVLQARNRWSLNRLALELGATSSNVTRWLWCDVRPSSLWADRIHKKLGIEGLLWARPPRQPIRVSLQHHDSS